IFGHESNFSSQVQPCFSPGMGIVFARPNGPEVDLLISLSCNQAKMDGDRWPHPVNGFTPETRDHLGKIYEKLWGPVPSGAWRLRSISQPFRRCFAAGGDSGVGCDTPELSATGALLVPPATARGVPVSSMSPLRAEGC